MGTDKISLSSTTFNTLREIANYIYIPVYNSPYYCMKTGCEKSPTKCLKPTQKNYNWYQSRKHQRAQAMIIYAFFMTLILNNLCVFLFTLSYYDNYQLSTIFLLAPLQVTSVTIISEQSSSRNSYHGVHS